jgi:hypothetical protein
MNNSADSSNAEFTEKTQVYPSVGYAWYVVIVLYLAYTLAFVDSSVLSAACHLPRYFPLWAFR